MRPTIFGGASRAGEGEFREWVLVVYEHDPEPERHDLVVVRPPGGGDPIVKRVVGLPGERIRISRGDLLIDGERQGLDQPRPEPVAVFDDRHQEVEDYFQLEAEPDGPWSREGAEWTVDARETRRNGDEGLMFFHKDVRDDYLDHDHQRVVGRHQVNDVLVECEAFVEETVEGACLRFELAEAGDTFQAFVELEGDEPRVRLVRYNARSLAERAPEDRRETLFEGPVRLERGVWHRLRFLNVDDRVRLEIDGETVAQADYDGNVAHPARPGAGLQSVLPRLGLGAEAGRVRFRSLRVLRDLYYTAIGSHATGAPLSLGPDEYFVLGDNSGASADSRSFGPVARGAILGRARAVVAPLGRIRTLR